MSKLFKVPVIYTVTGDVEVKAKDFKDLMTKLNDEEFVHEMKLPDETDYLCDSYRIDFDGIDPE